VKKRTTQGVKNLKSHQQHPSQTGRREPQFGNPGLHGQQLRGYNSYRDNREMSPRNLDDNSAGNILRVHNTSLADYGVKSLDHEENSVIQQPEEHTDDNRGFTQNFHF
jgi:hypothetical protein